MDKRILLLDSVSVVRTTGKATYAKGDLIWVEATKADSLIASGVAKHYVTWTDLRVAISATRATGSKPPTFAKAFDDGAGSQGVYTDYFSATSEQEVYFTVQFGHDYALNTPIHPHVHWFPNSNGAAGAVVNWGLEYVWKKIGGVYSNTTIISGNSHIFAESSLVAGKHYLTELGIITPTDIDVVSSMLLCRLFRDATGALGTDDYADTAGLMEFDFHYKMDAQGSELEYAKHE